MDNATEHRCHGTGTEHFLFAGWPGLKVAQRTRGVRESRQESALRPLLLLTPAVRAARQRALIKCWQLTAGQVPGSEFLAFPFPRHPPLLRAVPFSVRPMFSVSVGTPCVPMAVVLGDDGSDGGGGGRSSGVNASPNSESGPTRFNGPCQQERSACDPSITPRAVI